MLRKAITVSGILNVLVPHSSDYVSEHQSGDSHVSVRLRCGCVFPAP